jgi:hypothetical protein
MIETWVRFRVEGEDITGLGRRLNPVSEPRLVRRDRDSFDAAEADTYRLFADYVSICGSSCRTRFNNELWTSMPPL